MEAVIMFKKEKLIIIGGGPAGLTAAIYGARAGLEPVVILGPTPGGQITLTSELENYPGFVEGINGFELMQNIIKQAEKFKTRLSYERVTEVKFKEKPYLVRTDSTNYQADSVIIALGASPKKLGLKEETAFIAKGISYCATCDGALFKGKEVGVVGGGDVALEEANYLTNFCKKVYLIHRRNEFRGTKILSDRVKANEKIKILWDTEIREIIGENKLNSIIVENKVTGIKKDLSISGLFIAIGYKPNTDLLQGEIELTSTGYIATNNRQKTNKEGIFAAGDVQDPIYRQVITAAASGAKAAMEVSRYLEI